MTSKTQKRWCDDERGPMSFNHICREPDTFVHINKVLKDIVEALEAPKWDLQWNEVEWKSHYYENPSHVHENLYYPKHVVSHSNDVEKATDTYVDLMLKCESELGSDAEVDDVAPQTVEDVQNTDAKGVIAASYKSKLQENMCV